MDKLSIETPNKTVTIGLQDADLTITVKPNDQVPAVEAGSLVWSNTLLDGDSVNFEDAERAVANLGQGWRLPSRQELESILDLSKHDPAIDTEKFPDTQSCGYWTSTPCACNTAARWVVSFNSGIVYVRHRYNSACVRAVRSGQ